ncbi:MAG TPA: Rieske (2Fe-2S) protein [Jatrophihabitantaceae bacterium]|jgi:Rieske Fe-S protein|nr:Rieske (2Fe-2S) protein [Jatrophihabitantaceae bacterium]
MSDLVSRRSALRGAAVVVVGGIAGFALARNSAAAKEKAGTTAANAYGAGSDGGGQLLATVAAIPPGGGKILQHPPVVLTRSGATVHAFSAICTHQGCTVSTVANGTIDCPCHGSKFDAATGKVVAGPAPSPLPRIPVSVRNGEVYES